MGFQASTAGSCKQTNRPDLPQTANDPGPSSAPPTLSQNREGCTHQRRSANECQAAIGQPRCHHRKNRRGIFRVARLHHGIHYWGLRRHAATCYSHVHCGRGIGTGEVEHMALCALCARARSGCPRRNTCDVRLLAQSGTSSFDSLFVMTPVQHITRHGVIAVRQSQFA